MELTAWLVCTAAMLPVLFWVAYLCFDDDPTDAEMELLLRCRGPSFARQQVPSPPPPSHTVLPVFSAFDFPTFQNREPAP